MCYKVTIIILLFEIFVKEAGLNPLIVLVLASVIAVRFPQNRMEINLAEFLGQEPEKGTYTLRICIEDHVLSEQTPKHQSSQYYSIPFTVQ